MRVASNVYQMQWLASIQRKQAEIEEKVRRFQQKLEERNEIRKDLESEQDRMRREKLEKDRQ